MKKKIKFFVSYAHKNSDLANDFLDKLTDVLKPSRLYDYSLWKDNAIVIGTNWQNQIREAREACDLGLLLVSPAFLSSTFICETELPHFVGSAHARSFPVMLWPVDFARHDLRGLELLQIFRYQGPKFSERRAYGECKSRAREAFALEAFRAIETSLSSEGTQQDTRSISGEPNQVSQPLTSIVDRSAL